MVRALKKAGGAEPAEGVTVSAMSLDVPGIGRSIYQYGPAALVVFVGVVLTKSSADQLKQVTHKGERRVLLGIVVGVWISALLLVGLAVYQWFNPRRIEFMIRGSIATLQGGEEINSPLVDRERRLYVCKVYRSDGLFDIDWRLVSTRPLTDGDSVQFVIDDGSYRSPAYEFIIHPEQQVDGVEIYYLRARDSLVAHFAGRIEPLRRIPEDQAFSAEKRPVWPALIGEAAAATMLQPGDRAAQLESGDPIVRRNAWVAIAAKGQAGVIEANQFLSRPNASTRLRIGAVAALNSMKGVEYEVLSAEARAAIVDLGGDPDRDANGEARRFMIRSPKTLAGTFERRLAVARARNDAAVVQTLARSGLDLYHNLGVSEERAYSATTPVQESHFDKAVAAYRRAWELHELAASWERKYFPKALWGWANMLHDRSWLDRGGSNTRVPARIAEAQAKFREFIRECELSPPTPYVSQVGLARAYIQNPIPASLVASRPI